jgi:ABC-2 type transport system permease protein
MTATPAAARGASAFRRLRLNLVRNQLRSLLRTSRLRLFMIAVCSAIFWAGLFGLFFEGFRFLGSFVKLSNEIVEYIFGLFFLSLLVMLVFSTGIILYTSLFAAKETAFLLVTPAPADRVFAHKFAEATAFSSWGFLLLGSPMMVAYGITQGASAPYYALMMGYLLAFVLIPASLGGMGALLVGLLLPRRHKSLLVACGAALAAALVAVFARAYRTPGDVLSRDWLDALMGRLAFTQHALLPSRWMSRGLVRAVQSEWGDAAFYLGITAANAGMAYLVAAVLARDVYRRAYSRAHGGRSTRRHRPNEAFDRLFHRLFFFVRRPVRLLILKDLRTFRRDPAQWSQFLIFFGLLAFYFVNIRRLGYNVQNAYFRNMLSFLNLSVTALILSTFTSRFIFPMLSLEGRNFWVLGLLPLRRSEILWGKFMFSVGISLVATEVLVVLSDAMLQIGPSMTAIHMVVVAILCLGLSAISVGLGARMPNLKEDDPSKIAAGFGGTLNLLVSLVFIILVVGALALPCHLYFAGQGADALGVNPFGSARFRAWLLVAMAASTVLGMVATLVPLRIGIRAFERMEF